jgi:predicted acetyltransferase
MPELRRPSLELASSFEELRDAVLDGGYDGWTGASALALRDIPAYIDATRSWAKGERLERGWVPSDRFWVVEEGVVLGEVDVRHKLNNFLQQLGGHIGYLTHPEHRNKGVATFALREGLKRLAKIGVKRALITCLDDNVPSQRVIEKCGGVRIRDSKAKGPRRRRYVIALP